MDNLNELEAQKKSGITFIDFLFTIAVWIGLVPESHNLDCVTGLFNQPWVGNWISPNSHDFITLLSFILCSLTVILSWYGYHRAIEKYPHDNTSVLGLFRFMIDVLLVEIYALLLIKYEDLYAVLMILVLILTYISFGMFY